MEISQNRPQGMVLISCVLPALNEGQNIEGLVIQLSTILKTMTSAFEIVIVDDGSTDDTSEVAARLIPKYPVRLIQLSRNFGKELAIMAGLDHTKGDVVILMDADCQHPASILPKFFELWLLGYDMVYGIRKDRHSEGLLKRLATRLFYFLINLGSDTHIQAGAGDFRLMDRAVVDALRACPERARFMKGIYNWIGFKVKGIPFEVAPRHNGKTTFHFKQLFDLATTGITSFSTFPLRATIFMGTLISGLSILYSLYVLLCTLVWGIDVPGWATLVVCITFLSGIQLISIGLLGSYIATIHTEVKRRPLYIVRSQYNFDDTLKP